MPELPEVETIRRGLVAVAVGRVITSVEVRCAKLRRPVPGDIGIVLVGARILSVRRRAKYLVIETSADDDLVIHLGMAGRLLAQRDGEACDAAVLPKHDHVTIGLDNGVSLVYNDARRFGLVDLARHGQHPLLDGLGIEPLTDDFDVTALCDLFSGRKTPVKTALMNQRLVVGIDNIYASEALHLACIDPRSSAGSLSASEIADLVRHIKGVLGAAIRAGGTSLRDHRQVNGAIGKFRSRLLVYGREGEPCRTRGCDGVIISVQQSGRATYFCPNCQR